MGSEPRRIHPARYLVGVAVIFLGIYAQYVINLGTVGSFLLVYGLPLAVVRALWWDGIAGNARRHNTTALRYGLAYYGIFTAIGIIGSLAIVFALTALDPSAVGLLQQPNPVLNVPPDVALIMVFVSLLVVGPAEEVLFRGFLFGGLVSLAGGRHWVVLALASSVLFAMAHLYYALVYGIASAVPFVELVAFGMAMAAAFHLSGGNLLIPSLIHGAYDASGFIGVAVSLDLGSALRIGMLIVGLIVAVTFSRQGRFPSGDQGTSPSTHI
jgi:membrane protease YdiL (CAAX protease family)